MPEKNDTTFTDMLAALKALDRMNRGLDWCDPDEQARRWLGARTAIDKAEALTTNPDNQTKGG